MKIKTGQKIKIGKTIDPFFKKSYTEITEVVVRSITEHDGELTLISLENLDGLYLQTVNKYRLKDMIKLVRPKDFMREIQTIDV